MTALVLASGSSYRAKLLKKLNLSFESFQPDIDESPLSGESPQALAQRLAQDKAMAGAARFPAHLIIGSDQVAFCAGQLLGKPARRDAAIEQLRLQSARRVEFHTAICIYDSQAARCLSDIDLCCVQFRRLNQQQIERYVDLEKPYDCAGSFKSEGLGIVLFEKITGDDPNALIGLPLIKLTSLLTQFGITLP